MKCIVRQLAETWDAQQHQGVTIATLDNVSRVEQSSPGEIRITDHGENGGTVTYSKVLSIEVYP